MAKESLISKDEMNLAEIPFALLTNRVLPSTPKTIKVTKPYYLKGEKKEGTVVIAGSDEFGLPIAQDEELFLGIMYLYKRRGFISPILLFSRYELITILQWKTNGEYYERLKKGLNRLAGVSIFFDSCWWNFTSKQYTSVHFKLINNFELYDERTTGSSNFQSSIEMNSVIYESCQSGFIKNLNLSLLLSLSGNISKRLYRFLDKQRSANNVYRINTQKLAHQRLGLSQDYYPSKIKALIKEAAEELVDNNILSGWKFDGDNFSVEFNKYVPEESFSKSSSETDYVVDILCRELNDEVSKHFFTSVVKKIPHPVIFGILGNVKELYKDGNIKKSKGAYFTYLIKAKAEELNIKL